MRELVAMLDGACESGGAVMSHDERLDIRHADPNAAVFKPDPSIMLRQSVLSSVKEEREALLRSVGAADKARFDEYFASLSPTRTRTKRMTSESSRADDVA